jgi:hypothetical protein
MGEVYQYAVPTKCADGKDGTAFLWVPPEADRVRGVLVGGLTLMETHFAADPLIRQVCAQEKLAIVYCVPPLDAVFDYKGKNSGDLLRKTLNDLAQASGYREIAVAPLCSYGHSVSSIFARNVAFWQPSRCFAAVLLKGGFGFPASDADASAAGVPILLVNGQFEEFGPGPSGVLRDYEDRECAWKNTAKKLPQVRAKDERYLISLLIEPGSTHFPWTEPVANCVAPFLKKAAQRRIPDWPVDATQPVKCVELDPASGALTSSSLGKPDAPAAACKDFKGDPKQAFWHLDLELAQASDAFHAGLVGRKPQFVTFAGPAGTPIVVGHDMRMKIAPLWTGADTFKVAGIFLDAAPKKYPPVEGPAGHAEGAVLFRVFCGPIQQTGADTFRVAPDARCGQRAFVLAYHPGDATYRYAEQPASINIPARLTQGKTQTIAFAAVGSTKAGGFPLKLQAASDAGLPVRLCVVSGPAVMDGDTVKLAEIPKRAAYPLKLTVTAHQYGSAVEPLVQSAEPVTREILIER